MEFEGLQKTFSYTQINEANINHVFPLLCPVREKEWLDGWDYKMIYSKSGFIEKDCVFTTPHHGKFETVWYVTQYDLVNHSIEFMRITPNENTVKICIQLHEINPKQTRVAIDYKYTALNEDQNEFIRSDMERIFLDAMTWWEKAINYFLKTGEMLKK